jgi:hypothetical protein
LEILVRGGVGGFVVDEHAGVNADGCVFHAVFVDGKCNIPILFNLHIDPLLLCIKYLKESINIIILYPTLNVNVKYLKKWLDIFLVEIKVVF